MDLPNADRAFIDEAKLRNYLLSPTHPRGRYKADFFARFGLTVDNWQVLDSALLEHAHHHEVATVETTPYGMRYTIDGSLDTPDGREPLVRVIWFIRNGEDFPRLATAYPLERTAR